MPAHWPHDAGVFGSESPAAMVPNSSAVSLTRCPVASRIEPSHVCSGVVMKCTSSGFVGQAWAFVWMGGTGPAWPEAGSDTARENNDSSSERNQTTTRGLLDVFDLNSARTSGTGRFPGTAGGVAHLRSRL